MFPTPPKGESIFVEPLEARIAPTGLTGLANNTSVSGDPRYVSYATSPGDGHLGFVAGATYGVADGPAGKVFALKLNGDGSTDPATGLAGGDKLLIYNAVTGFNPTTPFLQAVNGNLIAFFQDKNGDGQVQSTELTGLALGKKTSTTINGNVNGDIVTNLAKDGNTITLDSVGKRSQQISSLNIVGNVTGGILSGGNMTNVTVTGNVANVLAGSAVNGVQYHFGDQSIPTATLVATPLKFGKVGATLSDISLLSLGGRIQSGDGGFGAAGGSITALTFQSDTDGFSVFSGNGGDGDAGTKAGAGGGITGVLIKGVSDPTDNDVILLQAGRGGNDAAFKGGKGGAISNVATSFNSFDPITGAQQVSADFLTDNIIVHGGDGGIGLRGGKGGEVSDSVLFGAIIDDNVQNPDGTPRAEIQVLGGAGGAAAVAGVGHGGNGGSIGQVTAENLDFTALGLTSSILVQAGNSGAGKNGGNVDAVTLLGTILTVTGGNGTDGFAAGGLGGSLNSISALETNLISTSQLTLNAGSGGASSGVGGAGGNIATVRLEDSALTSLVINDGTHANGGTGFGARGGAGGSVTDVQINDSGLVPQAAALFAVRSGRGGDGLIGGGAGGTIGTTQLIGSDFDYTVVSGAGGNVLPGGRGRGGAGGDLNNVGISNQPFGVNAAFFTTGTAASGVGGDGVRGGKGGDLIQVNLRSVGDIGMTAGNGGAAVRKAGAGGGIASSVGSSLLGSVAAVAGNAGAAGTKAGAGGVINAFIAAALNDITVTSGNGTFGGAGGDILNSGTTLDELTQSNNNGSLVVTAGSGSSLNGVGGAGGSVSVFSGYLGQSGRTAITAGNGGGGPNETLSGAGGSVDQIKLTGPGGIGADPVIVTLDAGNAGQAGQAKRGAAGGSVTNVTLYNLASGTVVQHVAAGDGASALRRGGAGGSIGEVHVGTPNDTTADIGFRSGRAYGYDAATGAGGLFAGLAGSGAKKAGALGNVMGITANSIASIAAGKGTSPQLAGTVDAIFLEGQTPTAVDGNGAFTNFDTANLVGSVVDPTAPGASTYQPSSGLIASVILTNNRDFIPEAQLTLDANGVLTLVDNRQPNSPVVTAV